MKKFDWRRITTIFAGFVALIWFLIRVVPKPSRAAYPCQRAAFPLASAFVLWISGLFTTSALIVEVKNSFRANRNLPGTLLLILSVLSLVTFSVIPSMQNINAKTLRYQRANWEQKSIKALGNTTVIDTFDLVSIARSDIDSAVHFTYPEILAMVREAVELSGGFEELIHNGDYVVLKPNLVELPFDLQEKFSQVSGPATDWRVTKAVAALVRELNPDGRIIILESSSTAGTHLTYNFYHYIPDSIPEVDDIVALEDSCGSWENYNDPMIEAKTLPPGVGMYPDSAKPNLSPEFYMAKIYSTADVVISIPVLKNHKIAIMTGGIKNVALGMTPHSIYGMSPTYFGKWTKIDHGLTNINKWLHDYYLLRPADYVVVDGLQGFDHGPTGDPDLSMESQQHNMRLIITGRNALSVDAVCSNIMSLDPLHANYLIYLDNSGYPVGHIDNKFIRVTGQSVKGIREIFPHSEAIVNDAIYYDYSPPSVSVTNITINNSQVTFDMTYDTDLNKLELEVNGELIPATVINDFGQAVFSFDPLLLPVDSLRLIATDRFYNDTTLFFDFTSVETPSLIRITPPEIYPNPTNGKYSIRVTMHQNSQVQLKLYDLQGRVIKSIYDGELDAGVHTIPVVSDQVPGTYQLTMFTPSGKSSTKLILVP